MINHIMVDMDGVVADFTNAALALHKVFHNPWREVDNLGKYSMEELLGISANDFWKKIDANTCEFWREMPKMDKADELMQLLESYRAPEKIFFLSSPAMDPSCYKGKVEWIRKHYPKYERRLVLTSHKYLLAKPDRVLIDDADKNCNSWVQANGEAVLVPRAWNSNYKYRKHSFDYMETHIKQCLS